jgi:AAA+ ATPase superfamily predicted ATPase
MDKNAFIGRRRELDVLTNLWVSQRPEFMILYGRRRVGKTRLLTHWLGTQKPSALYWVAAPTSSFDQLRSFSQAVFQFGSRRSPAPGDFSYGTWKTAFEELAQLAEKERVVIIIDEFTYLLEAEPGIAGVLQNAWDQTLSSANLLLILSGSHLGMMERQVLSYQAPLYGRSTANLLLQPLPFGTTREAFPQYEAHERVAVYAMLGGVPAYWERFKPQKSISDNIRSEFLSFSSSLHDEPRLLLADFLKDPHNYVAILQSIANGAATPKEIAGFTGLDEKSVPQYLNLLTETGFVARRVPVTQPLGSRFGRHKITDPFLRFYYRFLARRQAQLAMDAADQALEEIKRHLLDFIGTYTWEELCQEWLLRASVHDRLPFQPDQVGGAWTRKAQVDVVGINSMQKTLILGECKWSPHPTDQDVLENLIGKASEFVPAEGFWRVYFMGFARGGWTPTARQFASNFLTAKKTGENWQSEGLELITLEDVDNDLAVWS